MNQFQEKSREILTRVTPEEPTFLIRGADPLFAKVVTYWFDQAFVKRLHEDKIHDKEPILAYHQAWLDQQAEDIPDEPALAAADTSEEIEEVPDDLPSAGNFDNSIKGPVE